MILKPNMVIAGKKSPTHATPEQVASATIRCLKRQVPAAVPGIMFLSGGQTPAEATLHLSLMNRVQVAALAAVLQLRPSAAGCGAELPGAAPMSPRVSANFTNGPISMAWRAAAASSPAWNSRPRERRGGRSQ